MRICWTERVIVVFTVHACIVMVLMESLVIFGVVVMEFVSSTHWKYSETSGLSWMVPRQHVGRGLTKHLPGEASRAADGRMSMRSRTKLLEVEKEAG